MVKLALKGLNHIINVLGVKDLFWMPVQQYKQDGRIVRGLQRGAHSFSTSTAMAMLELSNRLVTTIQVCSETTTVICNNFVVIVSYQAGRAVVFTCFAAQSNSFDYLLHDQIGGS